jgi:hypothetical protein
MEYKKKNFEVCSRKYSIKIKGVLPVKKGVS